MKLRNLRPIALSAGLLAAAMGYSPHAAAEDFSVTSLQLLGGGGFKDKVLGMNTKNGFMGTATFEHIGGWPFGYNYFFMDVYHGEFLNFDGSPSPERARLYGEWSPTISLRRITGNKILTPIFLRDVQLAGQFGRNGKGFQSNMGGLAVELDTASKYLISFAGYVRHDIYNKLTYQGTLSWYLPLSFYWFSGLLSGFADLTKVKTGGWDFLTQPAFLLDVGMIVGPPQTVYLGTEIHLHVTPDQTIVAPQGMLRWNW